MATRPVVTWPDPVLSRVAAPVGAPGDDVRALVVDLFDTMYAAPGRGLAAPQLGMPLRAFVMDTGWKEGRAAPVALIDPVVVETGEGRSTLAEGCLSIPGITVAVTRPDRVRMRWTTPEGAAAEALFKGIDATCAQHELDHLDGIVTLDRAAPDARAAALRALGR